MKTICEFYRKGLYFCRFRWLPIEEIFLMSRNISRKSSQLSIRGVKFAGFSAYILSELFQGTYFNANSIEKLLP